MRLYVYSLANHVSQRVILLVDRKNRGVWHFGVLFLYYPTKKENINVRYINACSILDSK